MNMTDALQNYTALTAITVLFLVVACVLVVNNHIIARHERLVFAFGTLAVAVVAVIDWFSIVFDGMGPAYQMLQTVSVAAMFCLAPVIPAIIAHVIYPDDSSKLVFVLLACHAVLELVNIWGGFIFWVDHNNVYHRGDLYALYMIVYVIASGYLVLQSIRAARTYQTAGVRGIVGIVICMTVGVSIQFIYSNVHVAWTSVAMTVVLYVMFYVDMTLCTDPLTNLLNRRTYEAFLANPKLPCVVMSVDVNDFKHVNDTYGHASGDKCLQTIAKLIRSTFEGAGSCYRSGGDEFVVMLTRHTDAAEIYISRLHDAVRKAHDKDEMIPTVSIGYALADAECEDINEVVKAADEMMYEQKALAHAGR